MTKNKILHQKGGGNKSKDEKDRLTLSIDKNVSKSMKICAIENDITFSEFVQNAIVRHIKYLNK